MAGHLGKLIGLLAASAAIILAVGAWFLINGQPAVSFANMVGSLTGAFSGDGAYLVQQVRLPRLLLGLVCGLALGLAGTILQFTLRNPIADPGLLGISQAATLTVAVSLLIPGLVPSGALPVACLIAGLAASTLLVALARSIRDPVRIILIGVILAALCTTLTASILVLLPPDRTVGLSGFFTFTSGSVASASWDAIGLVAPWVLIAVPIALLSGRALNLLQFGDDVAQARGMRVTRTRAILLFTAALLVAPMVAVVGPVSFVALLSPHVAKGLLRTSNAHLILPASGAIGAVVLLVADTVGRLLFFPIEIPAGLWTILAIGPLSVWMASRAVRRSASAVS